MGGQWEGRGGQGRAGEGRGWQGEGREGGQGREGNFKGGILRRELASIQYIHKPSHNAALALETLVQMTNSEQVSIINSVL